MPSPRLVLHDIAIGKDEDKVDARALGIEFALAPLMRGQWHAAELHLTGATLRLGLDASGRVQAPNIPIGFSPDALSIDRLSIEDARIALADAANGGAIVLDKVWFNGEARSLLGPFGGEGAATIDGELYPFRLSTGRAGDDGAIKVHLNVDPVSRPLSVEADGMLAIANGAPSFDGTLSFARPAGIATTRAAAPGSLSLPWRLGGKVKVTAASALMSQFEFQYGSEEQNTKLSGTAEFKFGKAPRFDGVLSGRQLDLDRAAAADSARPPPVAVAHALAALAGAAFRPTIPVRVGIGIDRVTLGGNAIEDLRGDLSSGDRGWSLDRFEFRAPGFTKVRLSGVLAADGPGVAFAGPADIETGDPKALAAWVEGRAAPAQNELRPLHLRGDVTVSSEKLSITRLTADFERKPLSGRLLYAFAAGTSPARLEAELAAPELDIDAALAFGKALLAGSGLARPQDMAIRADIDRASFAGLGVRNASAQIEMNGDGLRIDRLSVADFGGNALSASGHIDTGGRIPHGALALDLDLKQPAAIAALAAQFIPKSPVATALGHIGRAQLHAALDVTDEQDAAAARLALAGQLDAMQLNAILRLRGDWSRRSVNDMRIEGTLDAPEGAALFKLIGLDRVAAAGQGPGRLTLQIGGPAPDKLNGALHLSVAGLAVNARVATAGAAVNFDDVDARFGASTIRGRVSLGTGSPRRIDGALDVDTLDAEDLIAGLTGTPAYGAGWSTAPFGGGVMGDLAGNVALKAQRAGITPRLALRDFGTALRFGKDAVSLDGITGTMAGGRFSGELSLRAGDNGLTAQGKLALSGADAAALIGAGARPPVSGTLDAAIDVEGSGFSAAALIGSLHGSGRVTLSDGQLAGLDPRAFAAAERTIDDGLAPEAPRVSGVVDKALESGHFPLPRAQGDVAISAGQMRLGDVRVQDGDAALALGGNLDLTDGTLDARLVLSGPAPSGGTRPDIFVALSGPVAAPTRTVDASALIGWLTLRAIENQSKRLKAMESAAQAAPAPIRAAGGAKERSAGIAGASEYQTAAGSAPPAAGLIRPATLTVPRARRSYRGCRRAGRAPRRSAPESGRERTGGWRMKDCPDGGRYRSKRPGRTMSIPGLPRFPSSPSRTHLRD